MQTFLPYPDFEQSAEALRNDTKRLGKQRVETLQILKALTQGGGLHGGWAKHPASRMWENYELALLKYQEAICNVWVSKGYKDSCWEKSRAFFSPEELERYGRGDYDMPPWFGDPDFHLAHKSSLKQKAPEIYGDMFADAPDGMPYIWPGKTLVEASQQQQQQQEQESMRAAEEAFEEDAFESKVEQTIHEVEQQEHVKLV